MNGAKKGRLLLASRVWSWGAQRWPPRRQSPKLFSFVRYFRHNKSPMSLYPVSSRVRRRGEAETGVVAAEEGDFRQVVFSEGVEQLHVDDLEPAADSPSEVLALGELGSFEPFVLRLQAEYLKHAYRFDPTSGLSNARVEPKHYQVYIAHRVTQKLRPRMILADEVGLGKTIEAGLIIKELKARQLIDRILVITPANLQDQWMTELRLKFNEEFTIIDGPGAKFLSKGGVNPYSKRDQIIVSINLVTRLPHADQILEAGWDLVVFDEAHRVRRTKRGSDSKVTKAYSLGDELKEVVNGILLLTATPMQLHPYELFSLVELIEPGLFKSFSEYELSRKKLPALNDLMGGLKGWDALDASQRSSLIRKHESLLREVGFEAKPLKSYNDEPNRLQVMNGVAEKHPLSEVLVRNRKAEIGGFTERRASAIPVELSEHERTVYEAVSEYIRDGYDWAMGSKNQAIGFLMVIYHKMLASSSPAIRESFKRRIAKLREKIAAIDEVTNPKLTKPAIEGLREQPELSDVLEGIEGASPRERKALEIEIATLEGLVGRLGELRDSKAKALIQAMDGIFGKDPGEKVLIFTQFIETQKFLKSVLESKGFSVEVFRGTGMNPQAKEEAVRRFKSVKQILISTEAGGEGRNFQFCHILFNYDLPWNPMKVEQRIGRLDRIGQKRPVLIYNLFAEGTVEERIVNVLGERIRLFEESVGSLDPILGDIERELEAIVMSDAKDFDEAFEKYAIGIEQQVREAQAKENALADFALDRASLREDEAQELLNPSRRLARWSDLEDFTGTALDYLGGTLSDHALGGTVISLSPRLRSELKVTRATIQGTFAPELAREEESIEFFAFGNELIDKIIDRAARGDSTNQDVTTARCLRSAPPGTWVEVYYVIRAVGIKPAGWVKRHLINQDLEVRSEQVEKMPPRGEPVTISVPDWVPKAISESKKAFEKEHFAEREEFRRMDDGLKKEEEARAERIFNYRKVRIQKMIDEASEWIREKETSGSEKERRVLPARRGFLKKRQEELQRLGFDYELELREIQERRATTSSQVLAAGLVVSE